MAFDVRQQTVAIGRQPEVIDVFRDPLDNRPAFLRPPVLDFGVAEKRLIGDRIPAFILARVDVALRLQAPEDFRDDFFVARLGGPNKVIVGDIQILPAVPEPLRDSVRERLRRHALFGGGIGDFLRVFVRAGQEEDPLAAQPVEAGQRIAQQRRRRRADMGDAVDVVDRAS